MSNRTPQSRLQGKRLLITGGSSGIARASAVRAAAEGADLALLDVQPADQAVQQCQAAGARTRSWICDISKESAVAASVDEACTWLGGLDVVVHVAGIVGQRGVQVDDLDIADWDRVLAVNLTGAMLVARYTAPYLEASAGALVLVGSVAGIWVGHPSVAYGASKGGLYGLALTLEEPLRSRGIRVNYLAPGAVDTPLVRAIAGDARIDEQRRLGRVLAAEDVAAVVAFLASDDASAIRGSIRTW